MKVIDGENVIEAEREDIDYNNSLYDKMSVRIGIDVHRCPACSGVMSFRDGYYCPLCDKNINSFLIR